MEGSMENSKPTDEQQTELEKQSTDTTIGSCSELLPRIDSRVLLVKELTEFLKDCNVTAEQINQIADCVTSPTPGWDRLLLRSLYDGESKSNLAFAFSQPQIPLNINSADLVKGWTDVQ